ARGAGAALGRVDPRRQGGARDPARRAPARQDGRATAVRGRPRPRPRAPRLRRQAAPDRTRRPGAVRGMRQAVLPRLPPGGLSALPAAVGGAPRRPPCLCRKLRENFPRVIGVFGKGPSAGLKLRPCVIESGNKNLYSLREETPAGESLDKVMHRGSTEWVAQAAAGAASRLNYALIDDRQ